MKKNIIEDQRNCSSSFKKQKLNYDFHINQDEYLDEPICKPNPFDYYD